MPQNYAEVIVDIAHEDVDRVFDYIIPDSLQGLSPGYRVRVPFGPMHVEGFVMAVKGTTAVPPNRMRAIEKTLDDYPALLPEMVDLALWLKEKYHCRIIDGLPGGANGFLASFIDATPLFPKHLNNIADFSN